MRIWKQDFIDCPECGRTPGDYGVCPDCGSTDIKRGKALAYMDEHGPEFVTQEFIGNLAEPNAARLLTEALERLKKEA